MLGVGIHRSSVSSLIQTSSKQEDLDILQTVERKDSDTLNTHRKIIDPTCHDGMIKQVYTQKKNTCHGGMIKHG